MDDDACVDNNAYVVLVRLRLPSFMVVLAGRVELAVFVARVGLIRVGDGALCL